MSLMKELSDGFVELNVDISIYGYSNFLETANVFLDNAWFIIKENSENNIKLIVKSKTDKVTTKECAFSFFDYLLGVSSADHRL